MQNVKRADHTQASWARTARQYLGCGILIVHDVPDKGSVKSVGMFVGIEELPLDDEYETARRTSLAVQLTTSFKALQKADYCKERAIKFVHKI